MMRWQVGVGPSWSSIGLGVGWRRRRLGIFRVVNKQQQEDHYAVLGVTPCASSANIKKAFRLLARQLKNIASSDSLKVEESTTHLLLFEIVKCLMKRANNECTLAILTLWLQWHPDVNKDLQAGQVFKSIHLAYQVLSDETARIEYDRVLKFRECTREPIRRNIYHNSGTEAEIEVHGWSEWQKTGENRRTKRYYDIGRGDFSYYTQSHEQPKNNKSKEERSSLLEVLQSVFLSVILMHTIGCQLSLLYSSLTAWLDGKLDAGYKLGYLIACVLGGRGGVLLSICLRFASWVCGKNSSSVVTLVIVAMWIGSNILTYAPLPQGVLLALLYMSVKLQGDLKF
ncbi:hypothetical protein KSS87_005511 [Heliosperma pusillum]|nr:hypothetical protein KSS87_005511 [Heliosperma pusillum]